MKSLRYLSTLGLAALVIAGLLSAQVGVTGRLSGTVTDQTGALIPSAQVRVVSEETGTAYSLTTNEAGAYFLAAVPTGFYSVEVTAPGFRKGILRKLKVDVATPAVGDVQLEVGSTTETVEVLAEATAVVTATSTIGTTITGRQITELPFTSRDALDLAMLMPGFSSGGAPRAGSFNALPKGAINITMDGVNTQDNLSKSAYGGGFFTYIRPRIDAIEEMSISTAVAGAESAAEGAIQIKFVTRRGANEWHGGLFEYLRNTWLNANYWFNNVAGQPRQDMKLNQWGGKAGGPIIRNRLFIFGVFDEFRLPQSQSRQRDILKTEAVNGIFRYRATDGAERTANVFQIAAANGLPSTPDPVVRDVLTKIDSLRGTGAGLTPVDLFRDRLTFNNRASQIRRFPTARLDWNLTDKIQWEAIWNYNYFYSFPDTLNGYDRLYPNFEKLGEYPQEGGQYSNRFSVTTALRYMITSRLNNEFRLGIVGGTVSFAPEFNPRMYPNDFQVALPFLSSPLNRGLGSMRNTPLKQISDNLGWQKGEHTVNFGMSYSLFTTWNKAYSSTSPVVSLGLTGTDPALAVFSATNVPNISTNDLGDIRSLYALLAGRISGVSGVINVDEKQKKFVPFAPLVQRERQTEFGFYFTDTWRLRQGFTINYGLRWEFQGVPYDTNGIYTSPGYAGLWGLSGVGNLFAPGVLKGSPTVFVPRQGMAYNNDLNNLAPNVGFAWSPKPSNRILKAIFGEGGAFRAGYGISYNREGLQHFRSYSGNPGTRASQFLTADRDFTAGSLLLRNPLPTLRRSPAVDFPSVQNPLPLSTYTYTGTGLLWFDPNLRVPYIQSWSAGIQREILKDTVLEVRYVGNHGTKLWRGVNLQEVNIFENGFLREFQNAQKNLDICTANRVACTGSATGGLRFDNRNLPGQTDLPIFSAALSGVALASGFASGSFVTHMQQGTAGISANTLAGNATYFENMKKAGYPANFFVVNPEAAGASASVLRNGANSTYNALQVEVRRRFSAGLLMNWNYTFSKGLTDYYSDASDSNSTFFSLRAQGINKGLSPYDLTHQYKANWIYELPFGRGKRWLDRGGVVDRLVGGWEWHGIARIQSGRPFRLTSGRTTFNQFDAGVIPHLTRGELQSLGKITKAPNKVVYVVDQKLIGPDGRANPQYLEPPTTPGQLGYFLYLHGPWLTRFDMTAAKKTRINERWNVELRAEFLNAFNHVNFMVGGATAANVDASILGTTFGQTSTAYSDISTTSDPGGRIVQLVLRINF
ncbi:MAG: carboxypeptidase-like regulatory domain-containing protein [Acidobacteriota bacterium]